MRRLLATAVLIGGIAVSMAPAQAESTIVIEYATPAATGVPQGIDASTGIIWYAETGAGKIVAQIGGQVVAQYALPGGGAPNIVKPTDDGVWFTDGGNSSTGHAPAIGHLNPWTGTIKEYPVPSGAAPFFLQIGRDGSKWFSEPAGVGRLAPNGSFTEWQVALEHTDDNIEQISLDPAGNLWFAERNYDGVGPSGTDYVRRLTPATNQVATYSVPTQGGTPAGIIANANGTVWVSEYYGNTIDLLDPAKAVPSSQATIAPSTGTATGADTPQHLSVGRAAVPTAHTVSASTTHVTPIQTTGWTQYPIPTAGANAEDMRVDRSGKVWFEEDSGKLGVLNPWASTITEWTVPTANSGWYNISLDPAGHLWFTEAANLVSSPPPAKIGVLVH